MNPVEKLVRRIRGSLKHPPDDATLQGLARDFARHCEETNRRLEQCAEMLRRQNEYQALELAEAPPAILDLVTLLSFQESDAWRNLCQKHKLAVPDSLDEKAIRQLNELYAKGISANHPLYKQYRETMLSRDFPAALAVLRSIAKLNPRDRNARHELERLENKVLALKIETLREPLDCGIQDALEAVITDIESIPWSKKPQGPLWEAAKAEQKKIIERRTVAEAGRLLQQMEHFQAMENWEQVQELLYTLQSRQQDAETPLPADLLAKADSLNAWAQNRREHAAEEESLSQWLALWAAEKSSPKSKSLPDLDRLHSEIKYWLREPDAGSLPCSRELLEQAEAARRELVREKRKRQTRRLCLQASAGLAVLALLSGTAFVVWGHSRINNAFTDVRLALDEGNISAAEARLNQLQQLQKWVPGAHGEITGEFQELAGKISEARGQREKFLAALQPLEAKAKSGFADTAFRDAGRDYEQYSALRARLPVEFRDEFRERNEAVEKSWNQFLEQVRQTSIARLQTLITHSEELMKQKIDFKNDLSRVREGMRPLGKNLMEIEEFLSPVMSGLRLPGDQTERARKITLQAKPYQEALQALDQTGARMRSSASMEDYLQAVKAMANSPFTSARETEAAVGLTRRDLTLNRLAAALLAPKFPNPPFPLQRIAISNLFPEGEPSEKERAIFLDLRDDPNLGEIYRCRINGNEANSRWKGDVWVFARGEPKNRESRISGEILRSEWKADIYNPAANPDSAGFDSVTLLYSFTAKPPSGTRIVEQMLSTESDFFRRIGVADLVDPGTGKYRQPVLKVLDTLRSDSALNPLFCAYVHSRLVALAADRPDTWGLSLSPSLQRDWLEIQKIFTSETFSSDWMVPRRVTASYARLKKMFDSGRSVSYLKEAMLLREYYQRVSQAGFRFAGFIDETNTLQGNAEAKTALELWGWDDKDFTPALLYQRASANDNWRSVRPGSLLSPVFSCPINRESVWNETVAAQKMEPQSPILNEYRPPFSRKNYER